MFMRKLIGFLGIICALMMLYGCSSPDNTDKGSQIDTGDNDLIPNGITFSAAHVADGEQLTVTLPIQNQQIGNVETDFFVHFYLSQTTTFSYLSDDDLGAFTVIDDIPGSTTKNINFNLTMPDLNINQCVYIYARIDSTELVTETNEGNNESSIRNAACILLYDDEDAGRTYDLIFETFPPTGTVTTYNTIIVLYKDNGANMDYVTEDDASSGSYNLYSYISGTYNKTSTYYLLVIAYAAAPYALAVRTSNVDIQLFGADLGSNAADPGENDDNPTPDTLNLSTDTPLAYPPVSTSILVGNASNRYWGTGDYDWFKIELP